MWKLLLTYQVLTHYSLRYVFGVSGVVRFILYLKKTENLLKIMTFSVAKNGEWGGKKSVSVCFYKTLNHLLFLWHKQSYIYCLSRVSHCFNKGRNNIFLNKYLGVI